MKLSQTYYNTIILFCKSSNVVDLTEVLLQLRKEGFFWEREDLVALSPYLTSHIKRFSDYLIDLDTIPQALYEKLNLGF